MNRTAPGSSPSGSGCVWFGVFTQPSVPSISLNGFEILLTVSLSSTVYAYFTISSMILPLSFRSSNSSNSSFLVVCFHSPKPQYSSSLVYNVIAYGYPAYYFDYYSVYNIFSGSYSVLFNFWTDCSPSTTYSLEAGFSSNSQGSYLRSR